MHTESDFDHLYFVFPQYYCITVPKSVISQASCIQAELICKTSPPIFLCRVRLCKIILLLTYMFIPKKRRILDFSFDKWTNFACNSLVLKSADLLSPQVRWTTWRRPSPTLPATTWVQPCSACWFAWCLLRLRSVCLRRLHCRGSETSSRPW